jgi:hypothetical protein
LVLDGLPLPPPGPLPLPHPPPQRIAIGAGSLWVAVTPSSPAPPGLSAWPSARARSNSSALTPRPAVGCCRRPVRS